MKKVNVLLQQIQLLNSFSNKIIVIPKVDGKIIVPAFIIVQMVDNSTPYDIHSNALNFKYDGVIGDLFTTVIHKEADSLTKFESLSYGDLTSDMVGKDIIAQTNFQNPTSGVGKMKLKIYYTLI